MDPQYEKMDRLILALDELFQDTLPPHTVVETFFEVWRREESVTYNEFIEALEWTAGPAYAADFDTLYWGLLD